MQQGDPLSSWEGRHQQADTGNWGSMMAFPSVAQVLQTELLKKLHHKGHCDGKYDTHYHHSPLGGPSSNIWIPNQYRRHNRNSQSAGEGPVLLRGPHSTNHQHVRRRTTRRGLWSGHQGNYPAEGSSWLHQLHAKANRYLPLEGILRALCLTAQWPHYLEDLLHILHIL